MTALVSSGIVLARYYDSMVKADLMSGGRDDWRTDEVDDLMSAILRLRSNDEAESFFRDLCTLGELRDMAQRWAVVRLLAGGMHYADISRRSGASTATITRIASWLRHGEGGYQLMLERSGLDAPGSPAPSAAAPALPVATAGRKRQPDE